MSSLLKLQNFPWSVAGCIYHTIEQLLQSSAVHRQLHCFGTICELVYSTIQYKVNLGHVKLSSFFNQVFFRQASFNMYLGEEEILRF